MTHATDETLIDYLHGELADAEDALVHAHLAACETCRARSDEQASIGDLVRAFGASTELEFPSMIKASVWATIRDAQPTPLDRLRAFFRPIVAVPLAATLALTLVFGMPVLHAAGVLPSAPAVSATYYLEEHAAEGQENPLADHVPTAMQTTAASNAQALPPLIDAADAATFDGNLVTND